MFKKGLLVPFLCFSVFLIGHQAEENVEVSCNINIKRAVQCVSDKFLSISVDPAVLLAGVNLSENSLKLAKHLSPAFIRIAGPTTQYIKYVDQDDASHNLLTQDGNHVRITPSIWFGINEWLKLAKITPIYGINDEDTLHGVWNPKSTLPLFDISEQLNISCYWQLGYDSSNKNTTRYKQDINIFHYILEAYSGKNETWKIIGSDISSLPSDDVEDILMDLHDQTEAIMWEPSGPVAEEFPPKDTAFKILQHQGSKTKAKLWTTVPKSENTVTFSSALLWAKQIGNAAKMGYDVVFRQPRVHELFTDTPVYWCSLLHKKLMGCHVLETKSSIFQDDPNIFAHCTRSQNSFVRSGALTVMVINDRPIKYKVKVKLGNSVPEKSVEVQTYILTSHSLNSTQIYLNDQVLTPEILHKKNPFEPKIRRTKATSHILLSLPPSSIGFFVLPGARVPVCIEKEKETQLLLEEIEQDQKMPLSEEVALRLGPRGTFTNHNMLERIAQNLKEEMESDDNYYNHPPRYDGIYSGTDEEFSVKPFDKLESTNRKHLLDRGKLGDKHKKVFDFEKKRDFFKKYLQEKSKTVKPGVKYSEKLPKIELSSVEIENLLKERAVERAAQKNIIFTDEELDALIKKASRSLNKSRYRRSTHRRLTKRDINRQLLEKYSQMKESSHNLSAKHHHHPNVKKSIARKKKHTHRKKRSSNANLVDLKAKLAERKKFWDDKRDELLGNSLGMKESLKEKIRELKSNLRIKRDINMDLLDKSTSSHKKKSKKAKTTEAIEATIRESGQTSADILDELANTNLEEEKEPEHKGDIYAELADSEDLDELELFDHNNNTPNRRKFKLFDKKSKIDPFAIAHPTLDIVDPTKPKSKKKKSKSDDKLQFLTTSEEFTDIEEDMPCIHEFFGNGFLSEKAEGKNKRTKQNDDFYGRIRRKRSDDSDLMKTNEETHEDLVAEIIQLEEQVPPVNDISLLVETPVIDKPITTEIQNPEAHVFEEALNNITYETQQNKPEYSDDKYSLETNIIEHNEVIKNTVKDKINLEKNISASNNFTISTPPKEEKTVNNSAIIIDISKTNNTNTTEEIETKIEENLVNAEEKPKESEPEKLIKEGKQSESTISDEETKSVENTIVEKQRKKRFANDDLPYKKKKDYKKEKHDKRTEDKQPMKKQKSTETLNEQMSHIKEKLQEKKDEIDKLVKKQKSVEKDKKEQWKSKLHKKKRSHFKRDKNNLKLEIEFPEVNSRNAQHNSKVKRSIFNNRKVLGNYQPITSDLKTWKSGDMSALKRDTYKANSRKLTLPKDYPIFKAIFNKPYNIRTRRYVDMDVDILDNEIDTDTNSIFKDNELFKIPEDDYLGFKLPQNIGLDNVNIDKKGEPKGYDIYTFRSRIFDEDGGEDSRKNTINTDTALHKHKDAIKNSKSEEKLKEISPFKVKTKQTTKFNSIEKNEESSSNDPALLFAHETFDIYNDNTKISSSTRKHENKMPLIINPFELLDTIFVNKPSVQKNRENENKENTVIDPVNLLAQILDISNTNIDASKTNSKHNGSLLDIIVDNKQFDKTDIDEHNKKTNENDPSRSFKSGESRIDIVISDQHVLPEMIELASIEQPSDIENFLEDEIGANQGNILDAFIADGTYKVKLPNNDELKLIKTKQNTDIKLTHNVHTLDKNNKDENEDMLDYISKIIPEIKPRFRPVQSVERILNDVKDFFTNVGKNLDDYLKQLGIK